MPDSESKVNSNFFAIAAIFLQLDMFFLQFICIKSMKTVSYFVNVFLNWTVKTKMTECAVTVLGFLCICSS